MNRTPAAALDARSVIAETRRWLEHIVIGLNLCPFANAVQEQIRFVASTAADVDSLASELAVELQFLAAADPQQTATTLLIHPCVLQDFDAYNQFLDTADAVLSMLALEDEIQIASFHPQYRFAGSAEDDIANCTNRSPHPTLHLLRQSSVERAVRSFPDSAAIYERNIQTLRQLGWPGWQALQRDPGRAPTSGSPRASSGRTPRA